MKERQYRIVKVTKKNGDICWMVQKAFKSWFTRKICWKYYLCDWESSSWTRHVNWATHYGSEESAEKTMLELINRDNDGVSDISVVKTVETDETGNIYITYDGTL